MRCTLKMRLLFLVLVMIQAGSIYAKGESFEEIPAFGDEELPPIHNFSNFYRNPHI